MKHICVACAVNWRIIHSTTVSSRGCYEPTFTRHFFIGLIKSILHLLYYIHNKSTLHIFPIFVFPAKDITNWPVGVLLLAVVALAAAVPVATSHIPLGLAGTPSAHSATSASVRPAGWATLPRPGAWAWDLSARARPHRSWGSCSLVRHCRLGLTCWAWEERNKTSPFYLGCYCCPGHTW